MGGRKNHQRGLLRMGIVGKSDMRPIEPTPGIGEWIAAVIVASCILSVVAVAVLVAAVVLR